MGLAFAGPVDGVGENDETDQGVARGLGEDGEFGGGVGIKRTGGGGFGGIVYRKTGPDAVGVIGEMEGVADQWESEESDGAESQDGGDGEGGIFFISIDGALGGDDGAHAANGRPHGE